MNSIPALLRRASDYLSQDLLRRIEIRYRLIAAFILLALLPIFISGCISYVKSIAAIKENAQIFSKEVVRQVSRNIELRMQQIETESNLLVLSNRVQAALAKAASGNAKEQSEARQDMARLLLEHYGSVDFINQKYLIDRNNRILDTQAFAQLTGGVTSFVKRAQGGRQRAYWGSYEDGAGQQNIGMVRAIIDKSSNEQLGNLVLIVRPEYFSTIFTDAATGSGTQIYILDASGGRVIIRADDASASADATPEPGLIDNIAHNAASDEARSFVAFVGKRGERYLAAYARIPGTTWFVVSTIAERKLTVEAQAVRNQIVLVGISGFLLSIFVAYFISHSITAPLRELVRKVHDTGDDAGAHLEEGQAQAAGGAQDELGRLAQRFEIMRGAIGQKIQKINEINASLEQTVIERTAELVARERESRTLIENSPDTIARYDRESRRIYANPAFCAAAGCSVAEALGKRPSELPGGPNALVYEKIIGEVIAGGKSAQCRAEMGRQGRTATMHAHPHYAGGRSLRQRELRVGRRSRSVRPHGVRDNYLETGQFRRTDRASESPDVP
ncbi:PAS domain S-box-containing protein [Paraburkholderia sp. WC7.3g]|uniref:cache domain-containing protein n=1 Tax=Paraburkholderia sp. WC7.3g TaxID=2991070 RepID=UPI003D1DC4CC